MGKLSDSLKRNLQEEKINKVDNRFSVASEVLAPQELIKQSPESDEPEIKIKLLPKSINLTDSDIDRLNALVNKFMELRIRVNQTEIIRMGLVALNEISLDELSTKITQIDKLKTGKKLKQEK